MPDAEADSVFVITAYELRGSMTDRSFPPGWDEARVRRVLAHYESHSPVQVTGFGTDAVEVVTGAEHTSASKTDGTLWCWGRNTVGQVGDGTSGASKPSPMQVTPLGTSVAEVTAGNEHSCARKGDGSVWCWGRNQHGQLGTGTWGM